MGLTAHRTCSTQSRHAWRQASAPPTRLGRVKMPVIAIPLFRCSTGRGGRRLRASGIVRPLCRTASPGRPSSRRRASRRYLPAHAPRCGAPSAARRPYPAERFHRTPAPTFGVPAPGGSPTRRNCRRPLALDRQAGGQRILVAFNAHAAVEGSPKIGCAFWHGFRPASPCVRLSGPRCRLRG